MSASETKPTAEIYALSDAELLHCYAAAARGVMQSAQKALLHARDAGEVLTVLKDRVPRGKWLIWLKDHRVSFSASANYMRVFARWPEVARKLQDDANFNLSDAIKLLATPRKHRADAAVQGLLPTGSLYAVPMIADWITVLRTMPPKHVVRSREALLKLRDHLNEILDSPEA